MGLSDLHSPSPAGTTTLGLDLCSSYGQSGAQMGAVAGLALSPVAWLAVGRQNFYYGVLPRSGSIGLLSGALAGWVGVLLAASSSDLATMREYALRSREVEKERLNQWATLGAGTGAMFATPGPGSVLFHETHWLPRLGGGAAAGMVLGIACFSLSCQPAARPYLKHLPVGMQPVGMQPPHPDRPTE